MNSLTTTPILQHCKALLSDVSRPPHRWQRQNVKIAGQHAHLSASEEQIHRAVSAMYTDPTICRSAIQEEPNRRQCCLLPP